MKTLCLALLFVTACGSGAKSSKDALALPVPESSETFATHSAAPVVDTTPPVEALSQTPEAYKPPVVTLASLSSSDYSLQEGEALIFTQTLVFEMASSAAMKASALQAVCGETIISESSFQVKEGRKPETLSISVLIPAAAFACESPIQIQIANRGLKIELKDQFIGIQK